MGLKKSDQTLQKGRYLYSQQTYTKCSMGKLKVKPQDTTITQQND